MFPIFQFSHFSKKIWQHLDIRSQALNFHTFFWKLDRIWAYTTELWIFVNFSRKLAQVRGIRSQASKFHKFFWKFDRIRLYVLPRVSNIKNFSTKLGLFLVIRSQVSQFQKMFWKFVLALGIRPRASNVWTFFKKICPGSGHMLPSF